MVRVTAGNVWARGDGGSREMNAAMAVFGGGVILSLAAIAVVDARTKLVSVPWLSALVAAGLGWLVLGDGFALIGAGPWMHLLGATVGLGVPLAMIAAAQWVGRRWPIFPGDALLLGAIGMILGLKSFLWALSLGCLLAVAHRVCLQRRRKRPLFAGYLAAGPGLAAGAVAMFVALHAQFALAQKPSPAAGGGPARIEATELLPVKSRLPEELAGKALELEMPAPLPFADVVALIGKAAEIAVEIEERPSRLADGGVELAPAGPVALGEETRLELVLDEVAVGAGYAWEWREGQVVFYRYWDRSWPGAPVVEVAEPEGPFDGLVSWISRVFGGGEPSEEGGGGVEPEKPVEVADAVVERESAEGPAGEAAVPAPLDPREEAGEWALPLTLPPPPEDLMVWVVNPKRQGTVRAVVEAWAARADWKLAWRARQDFTVAAEASFEGEFLQAVDRLLSDPALSRVLAVSAHANRYLVVRDVDG